MAQERRALILCEVGAFDQARDVVSALQGQHLRDIDASSQFRLRWTEGRIALGLGNHDEAERAMVEARTITRRLGNHIDSALISLDLALVHLDSGQPQGLHEIASFLRPVLQQEGLHEEASAALGLLVDAIERQRVSLRLVQDLSQYLVAARHDPSMKFRQR